MAAIDGDVTRVVLLSARVKPFNVYDEARLVQPVYAKIIDVFDSRWPTLNAEMRKKFVTTRPRNGDMLVPKDITILEGAEVDIFPYDAIGHFEGIQHMLTDGLERLALLGLGIKPLD